MLCKGKATRPSMISLNKDGEDSTYLPTVASHSQSGSNPKNPRKRKNNSFKFEASELRIELNAPIETHVRIIIMFYLFLFYY